MRITRYYGVHKSGTKFYEAIRIIDIDGISLSVFRYGAVGSRGAVLIGSASGFDTKVKEKTRRGYSFIERNEPSVLPDWVSLNKKFELHMRRFGSSWDFASPEETPLPKMPLPKTTVSVAAIKGWGEYA